MSPSFKIRVTPNSTDVLLDEIVEETDVIDMLTFDEEMLEELLQTHAAHQAYWESLAVRLKRRCESFEDEVVKKWWAHNRMYAKWVLKSYGEKESTIASITDMTITIYSEDTTEEMRAKYAYLAYAAFRANKKLYEQDEASFVEEMFKWVEMEPPWYFETLTRTERKLREDYDIVKIFAEKLNARSFHMKDYQSLLMAKKYNVGPTFLDERDKGRDARRPLKRKV